MTVPTINRYVPLRATPKAGSSANPFRAIYRRLYAAFGPQAWWPADTPFEVMVGAILTQNTAWQAASRAVRRIADEGLMSAPKMLAARRRLPSLIRPCGYYRLKARRLLNFLEYFNGQYRGRVENFSSVTTGLIRRELLDIDGIGPETADAILLYAIGRPVFVVDNYTRRIFSRHGVFSDRLDYEEIRRRFETNLVRSPRIYNEFHALIVRLGKEYCRKNEPLCADCPIRGI